MAIQRLEQESKAKQDLAASLKKLVAITPDSLIRAQELGTTLNF